MADFYLRSAYALDQLSANKGSIKGIVSSCAPDDTKRVLALVINTLQYRDALQSVLAAAQVLTIEKRVFDSLQPKKSKDSNGKSEDEKKVRPPFVKFPKRDPPQPQTLALVLTHDLLLSKRGIQASNSWAPRQALERHTVRLRAELTRLQVKMGKSKVEDLKQGQDERAERIPRFARVNGLKGGVEDVRELLKRDGWKEVEGTLIQNMDEFVVSRHVPEVIAFHSSASNRLISHSLYKKGRLILQDLASCFPAYVLNPPSEGSVQAIDATSAPGNKTSHLSAVMKGKGKITAFELSPGRHRTLVSLLTTSGAKQANVETVNGDFLATDPENEQWKDVQYILVDPSCSGSGIVNRMDYLLDGGQGEQDKLAEGAKEKLAERLESLATFQLSMIRHAMRFPSLCRLVYSTCSVHAEENERVVRRALESEEAQKGQFTLAPRSRVIPEWPTRGMPEEMGGDKAAAECLVRCIPGGAQGTLPPGQAHAEASNGFFVACFESQRDAKGAATDSVAEAESSKQSASAKKRKNKKKRKKPAMMASEAGDVVDEEGGESLIEDQAAKRVKS